MRIIHHPADRESRVPTLAVLLPGALQQPEQLLQHGFATAVRERGLPMDLAAVDLGLQFVGESVDGSAVRQLHERFLQSPAVQAYDEVWLVGISIGGTIAVDYALRYPERIGGLCLLAPYPGNRITVNAIARAGGLAYWPADLYVDPAGGADDFLLWRWLKARCASGPHVHLGYGLQDRFAAGLSLMADALDPESVDTVEGGHDCETWVRLWIRFLDRFAMQEQAKARCR